MAANAPPVSALEPLTDLDALRDRDDIPFSREADTVPDAVVDDVAGLPDLASVGVTDDRGRLLLRRLTDTCNWKLPTASVASGEDFVAAAREHVPETLGLRVALELVGVWELHLTAAEADRTATRGFVVFEGTPVDGSEVDTAAAPDPVEAAGWFADLPENTDELPGTDHFC